jgi:hydrogenase maturation protein HypF
VDRGVRTFTTTSVGRLFDTVAALLGFTRDATFEGQAATWLEHRAGGASDGAAAWTFPFDGIELDWRSALAEILAARRSGMPVEEIAAGFHRGLAAGLGAAAMQLCDRHDLHTVVLSGGVFQNEYLLRAVQARLSGLEIWVNHEVPANDGGISFGQAALALAGRSAS